MNDFFYVSRNAQPSMHFNRDFLISRLRPLVVEVSSSSDASSLTLKEKVERLREALLAESPEIIRKIVENLLRRGSDYYFSD